MCKPRAKWSGGRTIYVSAWSWIIRGRVTTDGVEEVAGDRVMLCKRWDFMVFRLLFM